MRIDYLCIQKSIQQQLDVLIPINILEDISCFAEQISFSKGEIILGIGSGMNKVFFVLNGIARSYYLDDEGNDVTKLFCPEMSLIAGESFFTNGKSIQSFEAIEDVDTLSFNAKELKEYFLEIPILQELYIKLLENSIIYKMHREYGFQVKHATERYLDFQKEFPHLEDRVNQSYIASYLGITPVSLSRIRRTSKEERGGTLI